MKILHVIRSMNPRDGGIVQYLSDFCTSAIMNDCSVEILCQDPCESTFLREYGFPVICIPGFSKNWRAGFDLRSWLLRNLSKYDLIIINGLWTSIGYVTGKLSSSLCVPYIVIPHGMLDSSFKRKYPIKHIKKLLYFLIFERRTLNNSKYVVFTSDQEKMSSLNTFPFLRINFFVCRLGVLAASYPHKVLESSFNLKFQNLVGTRFVLFLGRIHEIKGCDLIIKAFYFSKMSELGYKLVFAGPDTDGYSEFLTSLPEYLKIKDSVVWTGLLHGSHKWSLLRNAEVFVLPSHHENFGMAMVESLASGLPVLISDKVETYRSVEFFNAGYVEPDTLEGTIRLFNRWLCTPDSVKIKMQQNALTCFRSEFEISNSVREILSKSFN